MKLPIPSFGKKGNIQYLLTLLLRQEKASAVIIREFEDKIKVVGKHEEYFTSNLEAASDEEWLSILDKTISHAEEALPENVETHKTVFGLPETWIEEKKIKKEYLLKLKKASDELSLTPIGFLEIPEAIIHLMQEEEGAPVTAILLEIGRETLGVSIVKASHIVETKHATISDSPVQAVDSMLKEFTDIEVLPARVVIFDGGHGQELAQQFITHQWSRSLPFLHMPQVSLLPTGFDAKAVVFGAAKQMGFEILASQESANDIKTFPAKTGPTHHAANEKEEITEEKMTKAVPVDDEDITLSEAVGATAPVAATKTINDVPSDNFGFVMDQDVAKLSKEEEKPPIKATDHKKEVLSGDAEFAKTQKPHFEEVKEKSVPSHAFTDDQQKNRIDEEDQFGPRKSPFAAFGGLLAGIKLPDLKVPTMHGNRRKVFLIVPLILVGCIGLIVLYASVLRATIEVSVTPKVVEEEQDVTFSTTGGNDFSDNTIAAQVIETKLPGQVTTEATGTKETGEKATGTVTIYNSAQSRKELAEGATITSSNNIAFVLDKSVIIASSSGDIFTGIKSGTAKVAVTAKAIGTEGNIPSNTTFTIAGDSSLAGKNEVAFTGGTKKKVTVVDQEDIDTLTKELPESLEKKAKEQAEEELGRDEQLLAVLPNYTPAKADFSKAVGSESKTVTLKSNVTFEGITYTNKDLSDFAKSLVKDTYDQDLTLPDKGLKLTLRNVTREDDETVKATLIIEADLLPTIDENKLKADLAGKSFEQAEETFRRLPQVQSVEISLFPPIPFLPTLLPRMSDNIDIKVNSDG